MRRPSDSSGADAPMPSYNIDIEIFFRAKTSLRADVDNIIKPILDALVGILYIDDRQVRSVKVTAISSDEMVQLKGSTCDSVRDRLLNDGKDEFLIDVYEEVAVIGPSGYSDAEVGV